MIAWILWYFWFSMVIFFWIESCHRICKCKHINKISEILLLTSYYWKFVWIFFFFGGAFSLETFYSSLAKQLNMKCWHDWAVFIKKKIHNKNDSNFLLVVSSRKVNYLVKLELKMISGAFFLKKKNNLQLNLWPYQLNFFLLLPHFFLWTNFKMFFMADFPKATLYSMFSFECDAGGGHKKKIISNLSSASLISSLFNLLPTF